MLDKQKLQAAHIAAEVERLFLEQPVNYSALPAIEMLENQQKSVEIPAVGAISNIFLEVEAAITSTAKITKNLATIQDTQLLLNPVTQSFAALFSEIKLVHNNEQRHEGISGYIHQLFASLNSVLTDNNLHPAASTGTGDIIEFRDSYNLNSGFVKTATDKYTIRCVIPIRLQSPNYRSAVGILNMEAQRNSARLYLKTDTLANALPLAGEGSFFEKAGERHTENAFVLDKLTITPIVESRPVTNIMPNSTKNIWTIARDIEQVSSGEAGVNFSLPTGYIYDTILGYIRDVSTHKIHTAPENYKTIGAVKLRYGENTLQTQAAWRGRQLAGMLGVALPPESIFVRPVVPAQSVLGGAYSVRASTNIPTAQDNELVVYYSRQNLE